MVEPIIRHKPQTYYPTVQLDTKADCVLRRYLNSFIVIGGIVTGKDCVTRRNRQVYLADVKLPKVLAHFDPQMGFMMVPLDETLGDESATFQISRSDEVEVGDTITVQSLVLNCPRHEGQIFLAHDSATIGPGQVVRMHIKKLFIDAELCEWQPEGLDAALQTFDRNVWLCSMTPFIDSRGGVERIKMSAVKTKERVMKLQKTLLQIDLLMKDARDKETGIVNVPMFTKGIFKLQGLFLHQTEVEFYERIRNQPREDLLKFQPPRPLFQITASNYYAVIESTKKFALEVQSAIGDEDFEADEEYENELQPA